MANKVIDINSRYGGKAGRANIDNYDINLDKFKQLRTPKVDFKKLFKATDVNALPKFIIDNYNIRGLEFGNWVNQTRRLDYCLSTIIAFYDLNKIIQFDNNIGLNKTLSISYGARGARGALAHYETSAKVINISRDRRIDKQVNIFTGQPIAKYNSVSQKDWDSITNKMREHNSGYGAIAHEYGHAIDYIAAEKYTSGRSAALSGGRTTLYEPKGVGSYNRVIKALTNGKNKLNEVETLFIDAFLPFLYDKKGKPTGYYIRLYEFANKNRAPYWIQLNEIWARVFETYIAYKLFKAGYKNFYLVAEGKGKYREELGSSYNRVYPTYGEIQKNEKNMKKFLDMISRCINS